jgi:DNA-binding NarL/FixJ family response regulator
VTTRPIRVLLVEDNDAYRESLAFLLDRREGLEVVGGVATGSEAARASVDLDADVAVVDVRLPDIAGTEAAADLRQRSPRTSVVLLSASAGADEREVARVAGFALVQKDEGIGALVDAILSVRSET